MDGHERDFRLIKTERKNGHCTAHVIAGINFRSALVRAGHGCQIVSGVPVPVQQPMGRTNDFVVSSPNLVICEGSADQQFLQNLIRVHRIAGFQVEFARPDPSDPTGGHSKFRSFLQSLALPLGGTNPLENIILVSDNDQNPTASFRNICKQISDSGLFNAPSRPLRRARKHRKSGIALFVMMIPWSGESGALEHVTSRALNNTYPDAKRCAESYYQCMDIQNVTDNKRAKILAQCMVTTLSRDDPNCGVSYMWRSKNGFQHLLRHRTFNRIVRFLQRLSA